MKHPFILFILFFFVGMNMLYGEASVNKQRSLEYNEKGAQLVIQGSFKEAESYFKRAIDADGGNLTAVYNLAGVYVRTNRVNLAEQILRQYVEEKKVYNPLLVERLGDVYFNQKKIDKAIKTYNWLLKLDKSYTRALKKLAMLYLLKKDLDNALIFYKKYLKSNPNDFEVLSNLANIYLAKQMWQEAISAGKRALQIKSTHQIYRVLGDAYLGLKDFKKAKISYQRALDFGGGNEVKKKLNFVEDILQNKVKNK